MTKWQKAFAYLRGRWTSYRHFVRPAWVCQVGRVVVVRERGTIEVGERVWLWPDVKLDASAVAPDGVAELRIGDRVSIGDRTQIHCGERIEIGEGTLISWDCVIMDRDYHNPDGGPEKTAPVVIGERVWIGCRAIILKGVTLGDGVVVAAGSVVTRSVPPYTLVAGNPARVIRQVARTALGG
ncbi:hypothetical protein JCM16106_09560 [Hydrogenophilus islandicus]